MGGGSVPPGAGDPWEHVGDDQGAESEEAYTQTQNERIGGGVREAPEEGDDTGAGDEAESPEGHMREGRLSAPGASPVPPGPISQARRVLPSSVSGLGGSS